MSSLHDDLSRAVGKQKLIKSAGFEIISVNDPKNKGFEERQDSNFKKFSHAIYTLIGIDKIIDDHEVNWQTLEFLIGIETGKVYMLENNHTNQATNLGAHTIDEVYTVIIHPEYHTTNESYSQQIVEAFKTIRQFINFTNSGSLTTSTDFELVTKQQIATILSQYFHAIPDEKPSDIQKIHLSMYLQKSDQA